MSRSLSNAAYLLGARGVTLLSRVTYTVVVARALGAEHYGLLSYALSWSIAAVALASLALWPVMSREMALDRLRGVKVLGHALSLRVAASLLLAAGSAGAAVLAEPAGFAREALWIVSFASIGRGLANYCENAFNALERSRLVLQQEALFRSLELILASAAALAGGGIQLVAWAYAASWWGQALLGLVLVRRHEPALRLELERELSWRLVRQAVPLTLSNVSMLLLITGPLFFSRHLSAAASLGQLALLTQALAIASHVPMQIAIADLPGLSRSLRDQDGRAWASLESGLRWSTVFVVLLSLAAAASGPFLIGVSAGPEYDEAGELLGLFLLLLLPRCWGTLLWQNLLADSRIWSGAAAGVLGLGVLAGTLLLAGDSVTVTSSIVAMAAGHGAWVLVLLVAALPLHRGGRWLDPMVSSLPLFLATAGAYAVLLPLGRTWAALGGLAAALVSLRWSPVLSADERAAVLRFLIRKHPGEARP